MQSLEDRISKIEERNAKVESDKAWEKSLARRTSIACITYITASLTFAFMGTSAPFLQALVPTGGYLLSTLTLRALRQIWAK